MSDVKDAVRFVEEDYDIQQEIYNVYSTRYNMAEHKEDVEEDILRDLSTNLYGLERSIHNYLLGDYGVNKSQSKDNLFKEIALIQNKLLEVQFHFIDDIEQIEEYMWKFTNEDKKNFICNNMNT